MEIITKTLGGESTKVISMANGQMVRSLSMGSSWDKIRIGFRYRINTEYDIPGSPEFSIGLCSGTTNTFGSTTCDNFIGIMNTDTTMVLHASGDYVQSININAITKVGTTITDAGGLGTSLDVPCTETLSVMYIDFERINATTINVGAAYVVETGEVGVHVGLSDFLRGLEVESRTGIYQVIDGFVVDTLDSFDQDVTVDEVANGNFDSINIHWPIAYAQLEIATIALQTFGS